MQTTLNPPVSQINFPPFSLSRLLKTVFNPVNNERVCILIDLPDPAGGTIAYYADSAGIAPPGRYLPVSTPWASGDQTICETPERAQSGITARSGTCWPPGSPTARTSPPGARGPASPFPPTGAFPR